MPFDNPANSLVRRREDRGAPIMDYDIDVGESGDSKEIMMSWRGESIGRFEVSDMADSPNALYFPPILNDDGLFMLRFISPI